MISITLAKKKAWKEFSHWVRFSRADRLGMVKCVTCPQYLPAEHMQAGHFIPGRKNAVLYSAIGVQPQCYRCNIILSGNWPEYLKYMTENYGETIVNQLLARARQVVQMKAQDHMEVYNKYKELNESLKKRRTNETD